MKKEEIQKTVSTELESLREEGLKRIETTSLRPHGKMWGRDVFSWYEPLPEELQNTLMSFPAPIFVVSDIRLAQTVFHAAGNNILNVDTLVVFGGESASEISCYVKTFIEAENLADALKRLKEIKQGNGIILIALTDKNNQQEVDEFLTIHKD